MKMSTQHLPLLLSLLLSFTLTFGNPIADAHLAIVEGMVYCQSCSHVGTWSLEGAKPLQGAKVGIACRDKKNRVGFYKAFRADPLGYFYAPIKGQTVVRSCVAKLVSSPDRNCNLLTNINYGIDGSMVRYENRTIGGRGYMARVYATGPLVFRPEVCIPMVHY